MMRSIRSRLTIVMICLAVIPILLLGIYVSWQTFNSEKQHALSIAEHSASRVASRIEAYLVNLADNLETAASLRGLTELPPEEQRQLLEGLMAYHQNFDEMFLLDKQGRELIRLNRLEPSADLELHNRSSRKEFIVPAGSRHKYFGKVTFPDSTDEPHMLIGIPLSPPRSGDLEGVLVADLRLEKVWKLVSEDNPANGETVFLLDSTNRVVAHKNPAVVLRGTSVDMQLQEVEGEPAGHYHNDFFLTGRNVIHGGQQINLGNEKLQVIVEWDAEAALQKAYRLLYAISLATFSALCAAIAMIVFMAGIIVRPLQGLTGVVRSIMKGDFTRKAEIIRNDEIGELAQCFNRMTDSLGHSIRELETEVSDRKIAQISLENAHALLKGLIDSIPDMIFYKDRESVYLGCNRAFSQFAGFSDEKVLGKTDDDLFPHDLADIYRKNDRKLLEMKKSMRHEEWVDYPDGSKVLLETLKTPYYSVDGVVLGIIGISRDITERSRAEEEKQKLALQLRQAQKMEAIGTLAGGIAHDFNNILSAIIGYTELSRGIASKDDKLSEYLTEVLAAGNRAKDLVKQILTFSRISEQSNLCPLQIQPIIKEAMKLLRASIPTTIAIKQDIRPDTGLIVGNPTQVHQILINLCTNAYHAMQQNGGVLSVKLYSTTLERGAGNPEPVEPGRYNVLEVSDTGIGMDEEILDRIFEPYFTTKEQGKGTGMGLAVVHGIVKSYGGHIVVSSESGKGSTFQVYLPQVDTVSPPLLDEGYFDEAPQGSERILLIDDETVIVKVVKRMLEGLGYHVQAEVSSSRAFNLFARNPDRFDLVITDLTMPEMTGLELAEKLISARSDIPIILCSGYNEAINPQKLEAAGIREFLMKPLSRSELSLVVRRVLDQGSL